MNAPSWLSIPCAAAVLLLAGCGSTRERTATEQLLTSDAVDRSVANIDFRELAHKKVYLDTRYLQHVQGKGFVNAEYVISSLRQQMTAARCLIQDSADQADYVVEARMGALGTDRHEVLYGLPATNLLSVASAVVPTAPVLPPTPEIAVAKWNEHLGAAKIAVFAYHRESRQPVWQSGTSLARSDSHDTWLLGAGPFQRGSIHDGTEFAGTKLTVPLLSTADENLGPLVDYHRPAQFGEARPRLASAPPAEEPGEPQPDDGEAIQTLAGSEEAGVPGADDGPPPDSEPAGPAVPDPPDDAWELPVRRGAR